MYDYLLTLAARDGGPEPSMDDARLLADMELLAVVGDPEREIRLKDRRNADPLAGAVALNFGGLDAVGVKNILGRTFVRVSVDTVVRDVYRGGEAANAEAAHFVRDAGALPDSLRVARDALRGAWVEVDPYQYDEYARAVSDHTLLGAEQAQVFAAAMSEGGNTLDPAGQWRFAADLGAALRSGATLERAGQERGAELVEVRLPAGQAQRALSPLLTLLTEQGARFGLPPVFHPPADPDERVTARLAIRNGVLSEVAFDLGQFGGAGAGELPLRMTLTGGSAISLTAPPENRDVLTPQDLTVALMYLRTQRDAREENPERANIPGPLQP
ncbi:MULTISPECIES: hypothetical protein [Streptomyces]|uniref:hypothetical protein n=1 Tax=Streptomyces TaxID=1883 RepID=UPI0031F8615E